MAGRDFQTRSFSLLTKRVTVHAIIDFVAGSPVGVKLKQWVPTQPGVPGSYIDASTTPANPYSGTGTQGVAGIARDGSATGTWLLTLQDPYQRHVLANARWGRASNAGTPVPPTAPLVQIQDDKTNVTSRGSNPKTVQIVTYNNASTPAPTDPVAGERLYLEIVLDDSTAQ